MCKEIQGGHRYSEFTQEKLEKALYLIESSKVYRINQQKQIDEFFEWLKVSTGLDIKEKE